MTCSAGVQVCTSNPPEASALALLLAQTSIASVREKPLGTLAGLGNAKATFTALEVTDPAHPNVIVQGLRIHLEDEVRNATVYIDDEYYGTHKPRDYFEELACMTAQEIQERIPHPKTPELVTGGDLGLTNRRFPGGPVLNIGWDRMDSGNFTVHLYTRGCGNFFFPANAYSKLVDIFLAASDFFKKGPPHDSN
jgi:hypothetical protein